MPINNGFIYFMNDYKILYPSLILYLPDLLILNEGMIKTVLNNNDSRIFFK